MKGGLTVWVFRDSGPGGSVLWIEHHLFPDLPSNRYREISPRVRELFERHGLRYHAAPLPQQVASAWHRVVRLSFPNDWLEQTRPGTFRRQWRELRGAVGRASTS